MFTTEVMNLPYNTGFLFRHTFGKTFRGKDSNTFLVKKSHNIIVCPVSNLRRSVGVSDLMGVDLRGVTRLGQPTKRALSLIIPSSGLRWLIVCLPT